VPDFFSYTPFKFTSIRKVPAMDEIGKPHFITESPGRIFLRFLKFGLLAWGGPVAQIAMIRQELVDEEKWVSNEQFNRILAVYQILPGPEAHELCVHFGMLAGGRKGGILAGLGFMLPGFLLMVLLTKIYLLFGLHSPIVQGVFIGFQVAVIALIVAAVHRLGTNALPDWKLVCLAIASFTGNLFGLNFFIVLPAAGLVYLFWMKGCPLVPVITAIFLIIFCTVRYSPEIFKERTLVTELDGGKPAERPALPAIFYTGLKAGLLTFGGAYTAIPFVQQDAVRGGWLTNTQFLDGMALSGILPAPFIIFATFVGYLAGGLPGAMVITFAIFFPAFAFTLFGYKFLDMVIQNPALHHFLAGVTAAVIGLIALTAVQLFRSTITDLFTLILFVFALVALYILRSKFKALFVIMGSGVISLAWFYGRG
jgi:chromate transporter